jgi:hypothetical protein
MKRLTLLVSILLTISATSVQAQSENLEENSDLLESSGKYQKAIELDRGQDFGEELRQAFKLFKEAADEGNIDAAYRVGVMYQEGRGISINFLESEKYLKLSAYRGQVDSQLLLASKYSKRDKFEEAYLLTILAKALANTEQQFNESNLLFEELSASVLSPAIEKLQAKAMNCIQNRFNNCSLNGSENSTENTTPTEIEVKIFTPEKRQENSVKNKNSERELSNDSQELLDLMAETTIIKAKNDFEIENFQVGMGYVSVLAKPKDPRYSYDVAAQFTIAIDDEGFPEEVFVNYSYGKHSNELTKLFTESLRAGQYIPSNVNEIETLTYYVFFLANTENIGSSRRVSNRLNSQGRKITQLRSEAIKALEDNDLSEASKYVQKIEEIDVFKLQQYNVINQIKLNYYASLTEQSSARNYLKTITTPELLNHIDDIISPNDTFYIARPAGIEASYTTPISARELLNALYYNYKLLVQDSRLVESRQVLARIAGLDKQENWKDLVDITKKVEEILRSGKPIKVNDIIDDDGLAANYLSKNLLTVQVNSGNISKVKIYCETQAFEFEVTQISKTIELPAQTSGCRAFIFGEVGTTYSLIM